MNTVKTAVVVLLLLGALYGVYHVLNEPAPMPPQEMAWDPSQSIEPPDVEFGGFDADPQQSFEPAAATDGASLDAPLTPPDFSHGDHDHEEHSHEHDAQSAPADDAPAESVTPIDDGPPESPPSADGEETAPPADADESEAASESGQASERAASAYSISDSGTYQVPPSEPKGDQGYQEGAYVAVPPAESEADGAKGASPEKPPSEIPESEQASSSTPEEPAANPSYAEVWQTAQADLAAGKYAQALRALSPYYSSAEPTDEEFEQLMPVLDALAAKVVYSREHLLEDPYVVRQGETLASIAKQFSVPAELLRNINGVQNPDSLSPGAELKVVRGPFRAVVSLGGGGGQLALYLDDLYAGRFALSTGGAAPKAGDYKVREKGGESGGAPTTLDLGEGVFIQAETAEAADQRLLLHPTDAADIAGILSLGSQVTIRR